MAKEYRPKVGYEGLILSFPAAGTNGEYRTVDEWPHEPQDEGEEQFLAAHEFVTDQPYPKSQSKKGD